MPLCTLTSGAVVHWLEDGPPDGVPTLWMHGGSIEEGSHVRTDLEPFWPTLRVLCPDARGHGRSQKSDRVEDYTYARKAEDLVGLLDHLGIERALFGGASMGGALALYAACHHPDRVEAVMAVSGPPFAPPERDRRWYASKRHLAAEGRFEDYFTENVRMRMGDGAADRLASNPERLAALTEGMRRHSVASLLALLDETYNRSTWVDDCRTIRCPTLVISGSEDHFPSPEMSRAVAEAVPDSELHIVPGGSHFPNRTHREEVQGAIGKFLERLLGRDPRAPEDGGLHSRPSN